MDFVTYVLRCFILDEGLDSRTTLRAAGRNQSGRYILGGLGQRCQHKKFSSSALCKKFILVA